VRTKVGDAEQRDVSRFITLSLGEDYLAQAIFRRHYHGYFDLIGWNDSGTRALIYAFSEDNKTRSLETVDPAAKSRHSKSLRDTAWVGGPCGECGGWYGAGNGGSGTSRKPTASRISTRSSPTEPENNS